jgi:hypothetical protein
MGDHLQIKECRNALSEAWFVLVCLILKLQRGRQGGEALNASVRTVRRVLEHRGRISHRPLPSPSLTPSRKRQRNEWARQYVSWKPTDWEKVIFSDETYIEMCGRKSHFVRRSDGETPRDQHFTPRRGFCQKVLIWGCFNRRGLGTIKVIDGNMISTRYMSMFFKMISYLKRTFGLELMLKNILFFNKTMLHVILPVILAHF